MEKPSVLKPKLSGGASFLKKLKSNKSAAAKDKKLAELLAVDSEEHSRSRSNGTPPENAQPNYAAVDAQQGPLEPTPADTPPVKSPDTSAVTSVSNGTPIRKRSLVPLLATAAANNASDSETEERSLKRRKLSHDLSHQQLEHSSTSSALEQAAMNVSDPSSIHRTPPAVSALGTTVESQISVIATTISSPTLSTRRPSPIISTAAVDGVAMDVDGLALGTDVPPPPPPLDPTAHPSSPRSGTVPSDAALLSAEQRRSIFAPVFRLYLESSTQGKYDSDSIEAIIAEISDLDILKLAEYQPKVEAQMSRKEINEDTPAAIEPPGIVINSELLNSTPQGDDAASAIGQPEIPDPLPIADSGLLVVDEADEEETRRSFSASPALQEDAAQLPLRKISGTSQGFTLPSAAVTGPEPMRPASATPSISRSSSGEIQSPDLSNGVGYPCPKPDCRKRYKSRHGLQYHMGFETCSSKDEPDQYFPCGVQNCTKIYSSMHGLAHHYRKEDSHSVKGRAMLEANIHPAQVLGASGYVPNDAAFSRRESDASTATLVRANPAELRHQQIPFKLARWDEYGVPQLPQSRARLPSPSLLETGTGDTTPIPKRLVTFNDSHEPVTISTVDGPLPMSSVEWSFIVSADHASAANRWIQRYDTFDKSQDHVRYLLDCHRASVERQPRGWPTRNMALTTWVNEQLVGPYRPMSHREPQDQPLCITANIVSGINTMRILALDDLSGYSFSVIREPPSDEDASQAASHHERKICWDTCLTSFDMPT